MHCQVHGEHDDWCDVGYMYCRPCRREYKRDNRLRNNCKLIQATYGTLMVRLYKLHCERTGRVTPIHVFYKQNKKEFHLDKLVQMLKECHKRTLLGQSIEAILEQVIVDKIKHEEDVRNLRKRYLHGTSTRSVSTLRSTSTGEKPNVRTAESAISQQRENWSKIG